MSADIPPLDPNSERAERFLDTLADIQAAINSRKRAALAQEATASQPVAAVRGKRLQKAA